MKWKKGEPSKTHTQNKKHYGKHGHNSRIQWAMGMNMNLRNCMKFIQESNRPQNARVFFLL